VNKLKAEVHHYLDHWDWIHDYVNVYKDWDLTWTDVKRHKHKQISWSQLTLCKYLKEQSSSDFFIHLAQRRQSSCLDLN